ncbi:MAG: nicotinamide riboside transporter PnuC [Prevotellaceae bacterium]|jgi:nicotinamide mononucleotide transporter|nr:nicotinamide riboside transporter PnuC [Prevotellaceae bacterium]
MNIFDVNNAFITILGDKISFLEFAGTILSLFFVYFSVKEKVISWVFGFFSAIFLALLYFQNAIYANSLLQVYYVAMSVYGFWAWLRKKSDNSTLQISKISTKNLLISLISSAVCFALLYFVLDKYTDTKVPFIDAFTTALCIVGTYLLARKVLENWLFFIVADVVMVWLSISQKLYLLAFLYAVYSTMGVFGYFRWKKTAVSRRKKGARFL